MRDSVRDRKTGRAWAIVSILVVLVVSWSNASASIAELMEQYGDADRHFEELTIGDKLVYYHQRTIGDAVVEKDQIVYQLDPTSRELLARKVHWRDDLEGRLPEPVIAREDAEALVSGEVRFSDLYIISPESDVFPLDPTPVNPCWVVASVGAHGFMELTVVDAVDGVVLGPGIPPPYTAYSLTGPWYFEPCSGFWDAWSSNAMQWLDSMGYDTEHIIWPDEASVRGAVQSVEIAMFYELAHGGSNAFTNGCSGGQYGIHTTDDDIEGWIAGYSKMPFTFLGSCYGMCSTGDESFSHEFRKGSFEETATVGYCQMSETWCADCWVQSIDWQDAFFEYLSLGWTVKDAHDQANADYPSCGGPACMRFAGDQEFAIVPVVQRGGAPWVLVHEGDQNDPGAGAGVAWGDYDNDGDLDLYVANSDGPNKLFRNDDGVFVDATTPPLDDAGVGSGVAWGDYDEDGDLDLYVGNSPGANKLFRNDDGSFFDATTDPLDDEGEANGVSWVDFDGDGDLDLYVTNDGPNKLFQNVGAPSWEFVDTQCFNLDDPGNTKCAAWADYDGDGDVDVYLVNRMGANKLLENVGPCAFGDVTNGPLGDAGAGMGAAWGDYDNDGDPDLFLSAIFAGDKLLRNDGGGAFTDVTTPLLADTGHGTSVAWGDYDNDGDLDLYVANNMARNRLFENLGGPTWEFADASTSPIDDNGAAFGAAWGDYDNDGDLDLYVANDGANRFFRNEVGGDNHWLEVRLTGTVSNRSAIGARVRVVAGGSSMTREICGGSGYLSQNSLPVEFGLGSAAVAETLEVRWLSGLVERATGVEADQVIVMMEGEWTTGIAGAGATGTDTVLLGNFPNPFNPVTLISYDLPEPTAIDLAVYDLSGRLVRTLVDSELREGGRHTTPWDGRDERGLPVASGVYFYRLTATGESLSRRMILLK